MAPPAHCNACSSELPEGARFCPFCGLKQETGTDTAVDSGESGIEPTWLRQQLEHPQPENFQEKPRQKTAPERLLQKGTVLSNVYVIESVLGEGGMGVVYKARDTVLNRTVAIKALHSNLLGDMGIRKRFLRESRVMTTWSHPNVVSVFDFIETEEVLAFVMEFVDGPTLQQHIREWGGQMPLVEVRELFSEILFAMSEAHTLGIIHRDLKPDNILLQPGKRRLRPKIVDFGVAKVLADTRYTVTGTLLGTCRYMSPEQIARPEALDHRSDVYSLGVTLYQLVTGTCPFDKDSVYGAMIAHVREDPKPPSELRPQLPKELEALILETLSKEPDDRPPSCEVFRERLYEAIPNEPSRDLAKSGPHAPVRTEADGRELVLIPEGDFLMGSKRRRVHLDAFYIDRSPVTNEQFKKFIEVTKYRPTDAEAHRFLLHWRHGEFPKSLRNHPVVFVSREDALAYANWAGKRLPTEAEWEKSARGTDGRKYPWGREDPDPSRANFGRRASGTTVVGDLKAGASPFGVLDLAGNVWEWCQDVDDPEFYNNGPSHNPRNIMRQKDSLFVVRGGSWLYDARSLRTFARSSFPPHCRISGLGFRCATSAG